MVKKDINLSASNADASGFSSSSKARSQPRRNAAISIISRLVMSGPLNSAATTAWRVFAPAARVAVKRGATGKPNLDRFIFGHQYRALFGLVIFD